VSAFKNGELEGQQQHQLTGNGINNQPSWNGSCKPTLLKDSIVQGTQPTCGCHALTRRMESLQTQVACHCLRKLETEEVSNLCTTQHPLALARGVGNGAVLC
jgi:hypothetical protein